MTAPTPEERAEWQAQAETDPERHLSSGAAEDARRILALLAALEEAERAVAQAEGQWHRYIVDAERAQERAEAAEVERDRLREGLRALADPAEMERAMYQHCGDVHPVRSVTCRACKSWGAHVAQALVDAGLVADPEAHAALAARVEALADEWDDHADRMYAEARGAVRDAAIVLRSKSGTHAANAERLAAALSADDRAALDRVRAEERERIAQAIEASRDDGKWHKVGTVGALTRAARIARGGDPR